MTPGPAEPVVGSVREEAHALVEALGPWLAERGLLEVAETCGLAAEHLSGSHPLLVAGCPCCALRTPAGPNAVLWGHLGDAARSLRAAAASTRGPGQQRRS